MKILVRGFYDNPVIALGVLQAVAAGLAAYNVIAPVIGVIAVGVLAVFQRSLVTPDPPADARLKRKR